VCGKVDERHATDDTETMTAFDGFFTVYATFAARMLTSGIRAVSAVRPQHPRPPATAVSDSVCRRPLPPRV